MNNYEMNSVTYNAHFHSAKFAESNLVNLLQNFILKTIVFENYAYSSEQVLVQKKIIAKSYYLYHIITHDPALSSL